MDQDRNVKAAKRVGGLSYSQLKWAFLITIVTSAVALYFAPLGAPKWALVLSLAAGAFVAQVVASAMGAED